MADARIRFTAEDATRAARASVAAGLKSLERDAALVGNSLRTAFAGASVGSLVALGAGAVRSGAEINNLADRTGLAAREIQFLKFAAAQADTDVQTLATGMKRLAVNVNEAGQGSAEQAQAFANIGVQVKNADGSLRGIDAILGDVADVFQKMPDGIEKTALVIKLFGKAGEELLPFLNQGREGLAALRKEYEQLGIEIDERTVKAMAKFDDQLEALKAKGGTLTAQFFGPVVESLSKLADTAQRAGKAVDGDLDRGFAAMINARNDLARNGGDAVGVIARLETQLGSAAEVAKLSARDIRILRDELTFLKLTQAEQATPAAAAFTEQERQLKQRNKSEQAFADKLREIKGAEKAYIQSVLDAQVKAYQDANKAIESARQQRIAIETANRDFAAGLAGSAKPAGEATSLTDVALSKTQARAALQRGEFDLAIKLTEQAKEQLTALQQQGEATLVLQGTFRDIAQIQNAAAAGQEEAARAGAQSLFEQIQRTLGQAEALKKLKIDFDQQYALGKTQELLAAMQAELAKTPLIVQLVPSELEAVSKSLLDSANIGAATADAAPEPAKPQTQINLTVPGAGTFELSAEDEVGIKLAQEFQRAALKRGHR